MFGPWLQVMRAPCSNNWNSAREQGYCSRHKRFQQQRENVLAAHLMGSLHPGFGPLHSERG